MSLIFALSCRQLRRGLSQVYRFVSPTSNDGQWRGLFGAQVFKNMTLMAIVSSKSVSTGPFTDRKGESFRMSGF